MLDEGRHPYVISKLLLGEVWRKGELLYDAEGKKADENTLSKAYENRRNKSEMKCAIVKKNDRWRSVGECQNIVKA